MGQPDLSSYVKSTDLGTYVKNTELKNVAPKNHDHDDRYPSKTELQNYPDKKFLSSNYAKNDHKHDDLYQSKGNYLTSADLNKYKYITQDDLELKYKKFDEQLTGYQTQGSYVFVDDLNTQLQGYQTRGNYVSTDDLKTQLKSYQPAGNYASAADYALKTDLTGLALKSELTGYQKSGDYALKSQLTGLALKTDLNNYQTKGNYALASQLTGLALKTDLASYQTKGNYALASQLTGLALKTDLASYQTKGNYAFASQLTDYQTRGNYAFVSQLNDYQTKGNYALANHNHDTAYLKSTGNVQMRVPGQAPGSNNYSLEIITTGGANAEPSIRLHNPSNYWSQIRGYNGGIRFTGGDNNNVTNIQAWQVESDTIRNTHNANGLKLLPQSGTGITVNNSGDLIMVDGKQVCIGARCLTANDIMDLKTKSYPPSNLTANTTNIQNQLYGNGNYIASASTELAPFPAFQAFSNNPATFWQSVDNIYASTSGSYLSTATQVTSVGTTQYRGEWIQIQLPVSIILRSFILGPREGSETSRSPNNFVLLGSTNGTTWNLLFIGTNVTWDNKTSKMFSITNPRTPYSYYRLVTTTTGQTGTSVQISQMKLFGF